MKIVKNNNYESLIGLTFESKNKLGCDSRVKIVGITHHNKYKNQENFILKSLDKRSSYNPYRIKYILYKAGYIIDCFDEDPSETYLVRSCANFFHNFQK